MKIKITDKQIARLKACASGQQAFHALFPAGVVEVEWTRKKQIELIQEGKLHEWLSWLHGVALVPIWPMKRADFRGLTLRWANFSRMDLSEARLGRADLRESILPQVLLYGANLREADLSYCNLSRADLRFADLCGVKLLDADLRGVNFFCAKRLASDSEIPGWERQSDGRLVNPV